MSDTKENILQKLFSLERKGINPGLERIKFLMQKSDNPHTKFPSIHIAGTNGKGTTAALIASILMEAGLKVALYTSPHIKHFNERIRINGNMISDDDLIEFALKYMEIGRVVNSTFFEITTAIAFDYFAKNYVDIAVVETGLGGRLDATNIITPLLSIITSIGIEHTDYLGNTLEQIAFEKAGIIKPNIKTIIGELPNPAKNVISEIAAQKQSEIIEIDLTKFKNITINDDFSINAEFVASQDIYKFKTYLLGNHQLINHGLSILASELLRSQFSISTKAIEKGIENVFKNSGLTARFQIISTNPLIIIDTAHNPDAFKKLCETIQMIRKEKKFNLVFAAMADKDITQMLINIQNIINELIITQPTTKRAEKVENIKLIADKLGIKNTVITIPQEAFEYARAKNQPTIVAGSFYLLAEIDYN